MNEWMNEWIYKKNNEDNQSDDTFCHAFASVFVIFHWADAGMIYFVLCSNTRQTANIFSSSVIHSSAL